MKNQVVIDGEVIRVDKKGRLCLNDMHAMYALGNRNKYPSIWAARITTKQFLHGLNESYSDCWAIETIRQGKNCPETYAVTAAAIVYAQWLCIDAYFDLMKWYVGWMQQQYHDDKNVEFGMVTDRLLMQGRDHTSIKSPPGNRTVSS